MKIINNNSKLKTIIGILIVLIIAIIIMEMKFENKVNAGYGCPFGCTGPYEQLCVGYDDLYHYYQCKGCFRNYKIVQKHNIKEKYEQQGKRHYSVSECTISGCTFEVSGELQDCCDEDNNLICDICKKKIECMHTNTVKNVVSLTKTTHRIAMQCIECGYYYFDGAEDCDFTGDCTCECSNIQHTMKDGKCKVCGYTPANEGTACSHTYGTYTSTDDEKHSRTCTQCGNVKTENHTLGDIVINEENGTHSQKCTAQGCTYDAHGKTDEIEEYITNATNHDPQYKCKNPDCDKLFDGKAETHTYGSYTDLGNGKHSRKCTVELCGYEEITEHTLGDLTENKENGTHSQKCTAQGCTYDVHGRTEEIAKYNMNATNHDPQYKCKNPDCDKLFDGKAVEHTLGELVVNEENGTHSQKCTVCNYDLHGRTEEIAKYNSNATNHDPQYKCKNPDCDKLFDGKAETHTGATHENGGKCTVCSYVYETHGKSTEISTWNKTETQHTPVYKCVNTKCTKTYNGQSEAHKINSWNNNNNGTHSGECTVCSHKVTEEHRFSNDVCTDCGFKKVISDESCKHTYIAKNDKDKHWEECSKCKEVKQGSLAQHTFERYTKNNDDETHNAECKVCGYKLVEKHNFENGVCNQCGTQETKPEKPGDEKPGDEKPGDEKPGDEKPGDEKPGDEKPGDEKPGDEKPGDEKPGDEKPGDKKPGDENLNAQKPSDTTVIDKDIPHTGTRNITIIIFVVVIVGVISVIKIRRYKGI